MKQEKKYLFRALIAYQPFISNEDILREYHQWGEDLR